MAAKTGKITGEQLELLIDLCHEFGLFDFIFEKEDAILSGKEWEVYREYVKRYKQFADENKDNKDAVFATSGQEDQIIKKLESEIEKRSYETKKTLLLPENKAFIKKFAMITNPEIDLSDPRTIMSEVSGKLIFLKEAFQSM